MSDRDDVRYMSRALQLAGKGLYSADSTPRVGCVILKDDRIIGEGWHHVAGGPHAEVFALQDAGDEARGSTAYVTLEPCCHHGRTPPCPDALIEAGVARVVRGAEDPDPRVAGRGIKSLIDAGIEVRPGVLSAESEALNPGFVSRLRRGRPYVRCKMGMTLDGRIATASGESQWITSEAARRDVHRLRARSSAVMTGIGTVIVDDPSLTARLPPQDAPDELTAPWRIVLDSGLRFPETSKMLSLPGRTLIVHGRAAVVPAHLQGGDGLNLIAVDCVDGRIDLRAMMEVLARREEVNEVLVEAGPVLSGALMNAGLVDELWLYIAPRLLGDHARGLMSLPAIDRLDQALDVRIREIRAVGEDWRIVAVPAPATAES